MFRSFRADLLGFIRHSKTLQISFCWILGLLSGTFIAAKIDTSSLSLMRWTAFGSVSIVDLFIAAVFPFLIAAYAVYINKPKLLLLLSGCKAFLFSFFAYAAWHAYGSAGWLVQPLLQFTDIFLIPVLCWFCIRHIAGTANSRRKDIGICFLFIAAVVAVDYFMVAPFLAKLIDI